MIDNDCRMEDTGGYWWVLAGTGGYWWVLVGTGQYWSVLVGAGRDWSVLVGTGGYWSVLVGTSRCWSVLVGTGRYWSVLVGIGRYWSVLVGTGQCWQVLTEMCPFCVTKKALEVLEGWCEVGCVVAVPRPVKSRCKRWLRRAPRPPRAVVEWVESPFVVEVVGGVAGGKGGMMMLMLRVVVKRETEALTRCFVVAVLRTLTL